MLFDPSHKIYQSKKIEIVDGIYITSGRRHGPYLGSFTINYLEAYLDDTSYICDIEALIGHPRLRNEKLSMPREVSGNLFFEGQADKVPAIPFSLVENNSLYQFENCIILGDCGDQAVRTFFNFGFFLREGVICGAYAYLEL